MGSVSPALACVGLRNTSRIRDSEALLATLEEHLISFLREPHATKNSAFPLCYQLVSCLRFVFLLAERNGQ